MQTFLPFENYEKSAACLDKRRCWKQVVETAQILDILLNRKVKPPKYNKDGSIRKRGHANHPAVLMWKGYENALKLYFNTFLEYCINVHHINTKYIPEVIDGEVVYPWWHGKYEFHKSHQNRLYQKAYWDESKELMTNLNREGIFEKNIDMEADYYWPMESAT